jgi:hypothetical protein
MMGVIWNCCGKKLAYLEIIGTKIKLRVYVDAAYFAMQRWPGNLKSSTDAPIPTIPAFSGTFN